MQKRCAPADIFALGLRVKFKQNQVVLEVVDGPLKLLEKLKEI